MDRLPPEILHRIFILLDLKQRITCLAVCRSLWRVLDKYSLFYSVKIRRRSHQFHEIMNTFERLSDRAAQVQELDSVARPHTFFNIRKVINIFPNARVVKMRPYTLRKLSVDVEHDHLIEPKHSKSKVEFLSDVHCCDLLSQMLYSKVLGRLKVLELLFLGVLGTPAILFQLKDMPVLKKLTLQVLQIELYVLEKIHESVPSIEDFTLKYATIASGIIPSKILPATLITKLTVDFVHYDDGSNTSTQFYKYMTKKYINLTEINHEFRALKENNVDNREQIYLNGVLDFLKLIGPIKKEFRFHDLPDGINPFEALDSVDARIEKLYFDECNSEDTFQYLSKSKQFNYIETLSITNAVPHYIYALKDMPALTSLTISHDSYGYFPRFSIECLDGCPLSLKSLTIKAEYVTIPPFHTQLFSIDRLDIDFRDLKSNLGDIISNCFPNLVELKLTGCVAENIHITLKSPCFQKAIFSTHGAGEYSNRTHGLAFNFPNQTDTKYYIGNEHVDTVIIKEKRCVEPDEIAHLPILSVETLTNAKLEGEVNMTVLSC